MSDANPPVGGDRHEPGVPKDHVRVIRTETPSEDVTRDEAFDDILDDITDAELVEDDEVVARVAQDGRIDAASVVADLDRAAAVLAEVLEDDLDIVSEPDDEGEPVDVLTVTGEMTPVTAAAASIVTTSVVPADAAAPVAQVPAAQVPAAQAPAAPLEEVEVECPGCGLTVVGTDLRPTSSWFCPRCDYPLFLARRPAAPEPSGATRGARRRLPGTAGRTLTAAGACWNCGEWNEAGVTACLRCAATLPKPEAPKVPAEVIPPELEPELVEVEVMYWPPTLISALGGFGAGMVFLWAVLTALGRL